MTIEIRVNQNARQPILIGSDVARNKTVDNFLKFTNGPYDKDGFRM